VNTPHLVSTRLQAVSTRLRPHHRNPDVADLVHLIAKEKLLNDPHLSDLAALAQRI
jgi:hypothetical protein